MVAGHPCNQRAYIRLCPNFGDYPCLCQGIAMPCWAIKENPTMTIINPTFATHYLKDGVWTPKATTTTPISSAPATPDTKGALCPESYSRKQLLRDIEIAAGQALVRGYPSTRVAAARKGRLGNKEDNRQALYELLQWYKGGF